MKPAPQAASPPLPPPPEIALRDARAVLVSACLLGQACRYDAGHCRSEAVLRRLEDRVVVSVCPEEEGGLATPRPPVELSGGDGWAVLVGTATALVKASRADVTEQFIAGAKRAVAAAEQHGATVAILKEGSPSCGCRSVWVDGKRVAGAGVTAAALMKSGIVVLSDEALDEPADF